MALLLAGCAGGRVETMPRLEFAARRSQTQAAPEARMSLWIARADGRELLAIDADQPMVAASTIKVLLLVEMHAQAAEGRFRWHDLVTLREEDKAGGSGSLKRETEGSQWSWIQLARKMIAESDNTASNMILEKLGMERVNARAATLGMERTRFGRRFMDEEARRAGRENRTTAREMGLLMRSIYRREILTPEACDAMIRTLEETPRGRIAAAIPAGIAVGHKGGTLAGVRHDVGWVRLAHGAYVLSIFLENVMEREDGRDSGVAAIEAVSAAVFEQLAPSDE